MASIGEVGANNASKMIRGEMDKVPLCIYFGVFFDGTGNNMVSKEEAENRRNSFVKSLDKSEKKYISEDWDLYLNKELENGANKLVDKEIKKQKIMDLPKEEYIGTGRSNIAILHTCYQGLSQAVRNSYTKVYNLYIEGAGKEAVNDDSMVQNAKNLIGSGFGNGDTGVVALVSKAVRMVRLVLDGFSGSLNDSSVKKEIHFDVFGFSRGAACARLFSYIAGRGKNSPLKCEKKFEKFQAKYHYSENYLHFLDKYENLIHDVPFLGIYDTVSSIGITYNNNVENYGMFSPSEKWVKQTFHLCAMDEYRSHFALTDIDVEKEGNIEAFIPGCHSDVGGGYQYGSDSFLLNYCESLTSKYKIYTRNPESKFGKKDCISCDCLKMLGWGNDDELNDHYMRGFITCDRKRVLPGYSNIPLRIMQEKANGEEKGKRKIFANFPEGRYSVPISLEYIYELIKNEIKSVNCGRRWIYPGGSYCSEQYKILRHDYLHFSASDEIMSGKTAFVNSPNRKDSTICRIVYRGSKGSAPSPLYMYDYK